MRTVSVLVLTTLLGAGIGIASSVWDYRYTPNLGFSRLVPDGGHAVPRERPEAAKVPRLEVAGGMEYDFGIMERGQEGQHTFVLKNVGTGPLNITYLDKSCQCTTVRVSREWIPAGESGEIVLGWRPDKYDVNFHQSALFETNDPGRRELRLSIVGRVQQIARCTPRQLSLGSVQSGQPAQGRIDVFGYRDEDLELERVEFLHPETREFFAYRIEPMGEERLAEERGARSGHVVTVELKPGLPFGPFQQQLRLFTNKADIAPMEVMIHGNLVGDISIYGRGYQRDRNLLYIGPVPNGQPLTRVLNVFVRAAEGWEPELRVVETDPADVLQASVGAAQRTAGSLARFPLTISLRPTGHAVNRLGNQQGELGRIRIETNLPDTKEITIQVAFAL